jgi:hypothetical protein
MTPDGSKYLALALDALQAVQEWPEHAPSWWRLTSCGIHAGADKAKVADAVPRLEPRSPQARWFRHSALYTLTGGQEHLVQMAGMGAELAGNDRWMAFALLGWWEGLSLAGDRAALRKLFLDCGLAGVLGRVGEQLPVAAQVRAQPREVRRVAILAQHLSTGAHAGTAITFNLRAVLESAGVQTGVYSPQELSLPEMRGYSAFAHTADVPAPQPASWKLRIPGKASVMYSDPRFSIGARWGSIARQIAAFKPDLVMFVGLWSPLVWALRESFPVVGMSLHAMPPIAPVDVWLAAQPDGQQHWPGLPAPENFSFPFRFWPSHPGDTASRSAIDVPQDAVLMVSTGHRLSVEMPAAWCAEMVALLDRYPGAYWLLIGLQPDHHKRHLALHARIRVLPSQDDFAGWLRLCDVYVNPPRVGGGASVAMAMELGMAVASLAGSDGGDKIGPMAAASPQAFRAKLEQWLADAALRKRAGEALRQAFSAELDLSGEQASRQLLQACKLAQRRFQQRQSTMAAEIK